MTALTLLARACSGLTLIATVLAAPGDLDALYHPALSQQTSPVPALLTANGNLLLNGGGSFSGVFFDHVSGNSTGSRYLFGPQGQPAGEPLPGFLEDWPYLPGYPGSWNDTWFPLEEGKWLIADNNGHWLRLDASTHTTTPAFPDLAATDSISPQFYLDGRIWILRTSADGSRRLEKRISVDGSIDPSFTQNAAWPDTPSHAVPAADGRVWVLGGDLLVSLGFEDDQEDRNNIVFRVNADGSRDATISSVPFSYFRIPKLRQGSAGGFTVELAVDQRSLFLVPRDFSVQSCSVLNYDAAAAPGLKKSLSVAIPYRITWAIDTQGRLLATSGYGMLQRYLVDGSVDSSFHSPTGRVNSLLALPGGGWLINGTQELLPDGQPDPAWHAPQLTAPATVRSFTPLADGRVLVTGSFTSIQGQAAARLALLKIDGSLDSSFHADPRIDNPVSLTVSGDWIYAVNSTPVTLSGGQATTLLRMSLTGTLDETYLPGIGIVGPGSAVLILEQTYAGVFPAPNDGILAEGENNVDVPTASLIRIDSDGKVLGSFPSIYGASAGRILVTSSGGVIIGGTWYAADGTKIRSLGGAAALSPVCEWQDGILFTEDIATTVFQGKRLRLWHHGRWEPNFSAPPVSGSVDASAGENGSLYIATTWPDGSQDLRRMTPGGQLDSTFRAPPFTSRVRREPGPWLTAQDGAVSAYDPATSEFQQTPGWMYHPESGRLWVGGAFNRVADQDRDGLAWLQVGGTLPSSPATDAWHAWLQGMTLTSADADADTDGDGVSNAQEFLFGTDPRVPSSGPIASVLDQNLVFAYQLSAEAQDYPPVAEFSSDLIHWTAATTSNATITSTATPGAGDTQTIQVTIPRAARDRLYVRLRATLP